MSSLTPPEAAERLARIRKNDIFNSLIATPRWGLNNYPSPVKSNNSLIRPSAPATLTTTTGKLIKRRYGRFKVLAHLVSTLTVHHEDSNWKILADLFAQGVTGVDRIVLIGTANPFRLGVWILVFATLIITTLYFIALTVIEYWKYKTIVTVSQLMGVERILPAITFCNVNAFRVDVLCDPGGALYAARHEMCIKADNDNEFVNLMTKFKTYATINETIRTIIDDSVYEWEDQAISCTFNQKDCQTEWVQHLVVSFFRFGQCFCIFCDESKVDSSVNFADPGSGLQNPSNGLNLVLNSSRETYLNSTESFGFLVMVHDRTRLPDPNMDGIYAPVAMTTFIGFKKKQVNLLKSPYKSNCHTDWPDGEPYNVYLTGDDPYSEESCRKVCINYNIMVMCHCLDLYKGTNMQNLLDSNSICVDDIMRQNCREKFVQNPENLTDMCNCPKRCEETSYRLSVSQVGWQEILHEGGADQAQSTSLTNIVVYLQDTAIDTIVESQETSATTALSSVGGFLNMFTGTSFLLIYEAFSIFVIWFYKMFTASRRRRRNRIDLFNLKS